MQRSNSKKSKGSFTHLYLSRWHRDNPGDGCTMAALAQEVARSTPNSKPRSSKDFRTFSPLSAETGKKPSFG